MSLIHVICLMMAAINALISENELRLSEKSMEVSMTSNIKSDIKKNKYALKMESNSLIEDKYLFIILESVNPDIVLSVLKPERESILMDVSTFSGNSVLVISDTYFNGQMNFIKELQVLKFKVWSKSNEGDMKYTVRAAIGIDLSLEFGRVYTTRVDFNVSSLQIKLKYKGLQQSELRKLRFQVTSVRQSRDYSLEARVSYEGKEFELNTIFTKTVGGILSLPNWPVCVLENCEYAMNIKMSKIKMMNIESFLIGKMEVLSIDHYEEYYDRTYEDNVVTMYELPYQESLNEMDVTVSLIPVIGTTSLYINARTIPLELDNFDWKEKSRLAKRVTIKWSELVQMRAEKSNLYIAVQTSRAGEFLIKIDAHEPGYKGRLSSGIIESGFVQFEEINNYLFFFEVYEKQEITFNVSMNIISGDADLYVRQCVNSEECMFDGQSIHDSATLGVENNQNSKQLTVTFTCDHQPTSVISTCQYLIGVRGKENHGTHYEITLQENDFHRLMVPGHSVPLNLNAEQKTYLKFSHPVGSGESQLFLNVEAHWGTFEVVISRSSSFPEPNAEHSITEPFNPTKLGLYSSLKSIQLNAKALGTEDIHGIYYVAVIARTSCSLNMRFYEKNEKQPTIHTLVAGTQLRGELTSKSKTVYYIIKVSLEVKQASTISIYLTPLKGEYMMFANKNGKLPNAENKEFYSMDNHLDLSYQIDENTHDEYIIGVQLADNCHEDSYQFMISMSYSNKALKLNPGILSQYVVSDSNFYFIEIAQEMRQLIILKSLIDGFSLRLCGWFKESKSMCDYVADEFTAALIISETDVDTHCADKMQKCFLQLRVNGPNNQKFSIGFTYNDYPFQLTRSLLVTGPIITNERKSITFVYHAEQNKPTLIVFNSKGHEMTIDTRMVKEEGNRPSQTVNGYITSIFYDKKTTSSVGANPEIVITLGTKQKAEASLDVSHYFVLQASIDAQELLRTQNHSENIIKNMWNYYTIYNNGNSNTLKIYVSSAIMTRLEVLVSKGMQARPPFSSKPIASKVGMGSIDLSLSKSHSSKESLKGHYTIGVMSSSNCNLNIFWNNNRNLNYIEVTPNTPMTMALETSKKLYFSFYVADGPSNVDSMKGIVSIYAKTNVSVTIYVLKTNGELEAPSKKHFNWKEVIPMYGGITTIQIKPEDKDYCVNCQYMGVIETSEAGQVSMLVNVRHSGLAIPLTPGFTFPELIYAGERILFKVWNENTDQIDVSVSMLSGFIDIRVYVDESKNAESIKLGSLMEVHRFIPIIPSIYNIATAHDYYILVTNNEAQSAAFSITVDKNSIKSPIEPGITKYLHIGPNESTDYIYTPKESEKTFEIRLEIRQVFDEKYVHEILQKMDKFVTLFHVNEHNDRYMMKIKKTSISENKAFFSFSIKENKKGSFAIHVSNPTLVFIALSVDLLNGNYKLLNFNEFTIDRLRKRESMVYEGYGARSKLLYIDVKMCHGEVDVEYFQNDFENIEKMNSTAFKSITTGNSMVHSVEMKHEHVFLRIKNKGNVKAIFELSVFNERDLETSPYSEIAEGNGGKVRIELDNDVISFEPVKLTSTYSSDFYHVVNYTLILSNEKLVTRYAKNCGRYMIEHVWSNPHLLTFSFPIVFRTNSEIQTFQKQIKIQLVKLNRSTKYYGVIVARVDLFPKEGGYLSPTRSGKVYYDEFVFITAKYDVPINLVISLIACMGVFGLLFYIIKAYMFGSLNRLAEFEKLGDLSDVDEGFLGLNFMSEMEREYFEEEKERRMSKNIEMK